MIQIEIGASNCLIDAKDEERMNSAHDGVVQNVGGSWTGRRSAERRPDQQLSTVQFGDFNRRE